MTLHRLDHADRFVVLSQQAGALNREIVIRRTAEAQREGLLLAEQAARARLPRLYQLTEAMAPLATLARVSEAVASTAAHALDGVPLELHSQRLVPALAPGEEPRVQTGDLWRDLDRPTDAGQAAAPSAARISL